ncbi:hypothetical protein FRAHR75_770035 [Frankia sp. Hr75.2]|nr:hypothetical protein FRAHR75_770035 [Frankia sp. Hr75.2]
MLTDQSIDEEMSRAALELAGRFGRGRPAGSGDIGDVGGRESEPWGEPTPLTVGLPDFPLAALPGAIGDIVRAVRDSTQTPADLGAVTALATLSAATRGKFRADVSRSWSEETAIYTAALSDSGTRKTAVVKEITRPLAAIAKELRTAGRGVYLEESAAYRIAQARAHAAEQAAAKLSAGPDAEATARAAAREAGEMREPAELRILADDVTPEALGKIMAAQGGPISVISAEGGILGTLAGRYSDGRANVDLVLKAYDGESVWIDRISREPLFIERPFLTLGIIAQPDVIAEATQVRAFTERGLLPRMLFAMPPTTVGSRRLDAPDVPEHVAYIWEQCVGKILRAAAVNGDEQTVLRLDADALAVLNEFRADLEPRLHPDIGDLTRILAWASKLPGALVRIAALFALAEDAGVAWVRVEHMLAAVAMSDYLIAHARAVLTLDKHRRDSRQVTMLSWIRRRASPQSPELNDRAGIGDCGDAFTTRDAWQGVRGRAWAESASDVQTVLDQLVELGWIRRRPDPPRRPGRPPSPSYEAHPQLHTAGGGRGPWEIDPRCAA